MVCRALRTACRCSCLVIQRLDARMSCVQPLASMAAAADLYSQAHLSKTMFSRSAPSTVWATCTSWTPLPLQLISLTSPSMVAKSRFNPMYREERLLGSFGERHEKQILRWSAIPLHHLWEPLTVNQIPAVSQPAEDLWR